MPAQPPFYGVTKYGAGGYGGTVANADPTVTILAPTQGQIISTGGPSITVSWVYGQAQGVPQSHWRVKISDGTVVYDTGFRVGGDDEHTVDLIAAGLNPDTGGLLYRLDVSVRSEDGPLYEGTAFITFDVQWGLVTTEITFPLDDAVLHTESVTVTWDFESTRAKVQEQFRVRLLTETGIVLVDSGWRIGADSSFAVPWILSHGSEYQLGVQTKNEEGVLSLPFSGGGGGGGEEGAYPGGYEEGY